MRECYRDEIAKCIEEHEFFVTPQTGNSYLVLYWVGVYSDVRIELFLGNIGHHSDVKAIREFAAKIRLQGL